MFPKILKQNIFLLLHKPAQKKKYFVYLLVVQYYICSFFFDFSYMNQQIFANQPIKLIKFTRKKKYPYTYKEKQILLLFSYLIFRKEKAYFCFQYKIGRDFQKFLYQFYSEGDKQNQILFKKFLNVEYNFLLFVPLHQDYFIQVQNIDRCTFSEQYIDRKRQTVTKSLQQKE
ncbi:transmembrane protein, putative (macronuclear) [Tetrahymena thermophila SB210]|uniref:Transmembrane protein, putative n=1 Tax=Tetrahymena thermophila (strain SB210) TaxID=312017 RepID=W7XFF7_TETTS|nr:transmembrane protein, putative [Tetrahymena thermophila SB210]EWS76562.1 transmembrane protein, putative [Tetrahymena thermophila SB210]|eukprot:XP_012650848.1 transmembrane protein, putative [Tetrahymena thermophila SB210]